MTTSVLIVTDSKIFRENVYSFLPMFPNLGIVVEAGNVDNALIITRDLKPDMVILDWHLQSNNGADMMQLLLNECPEIKVIIFSKLAVGSYNKVAALRGARANVLRNELAFHLAKATYAISEGYRYFSPSMRIDMSDSVSHGNAHL